jgi:tetratricopeptide (TPR) repeat protein
MKNFYPTLFFIFLSLGVYAKGALDVMQPDTSEVIAFNKNGYNSRLTKPTETIEYANKALALAKKIKYINGIAEAFRVRGIGEYYLNKFDIAINDYLDALNYYDRSNDQSGKAKVYNNIGNLYKEVDYEKALDYFNRAAVIAKITHDDQLIASLNLNIGNVYYNKNSFNQALKYYTLSYEQFSKLNNKVLIVQCLQDLGAIYIKLNQTDTAKKILLEANEAAKAQDLNSSIANINLVLTDMFKREGNFAEAKKYLKEGLISAQLVNNDLYLYDYDKTAYELAFAEKNYEKAITYLHKLFDQDSVTYNSNLSTKFNLASKEQQHQREVELAAKDSAIANQRFWLLAAMAGLLVIVIGLLMGNVKRKATTNAKLTELNNEISRQKDNLDRINHHLEEIIDERTRDLQVKNKKLSEYSSYLSHQIRGPIATLKGLMNLEKEGLVDKEECITMMDKCVSEIDEKIIEMSDMLHDPGKNGF